jgi:hypothetical protein
LDHQWSLTTYQGHHDIDTFIHVGVISEVTPPEMTVLINLNTQILCAAGYSYIITLILIDELFQLHVPVKLTWNLVT